ncbi:MAG: hypothetical protein WBD55_04995 [Dehalococcoidia bacterium]
MGRIACAAALCLILTPIGVGCRNDSYNARTAPETAVPAVASPAIITPTPVFQLRSVHYRTDITMRSTLADGTKTGYGARMEGDMVAPNSYSVHAEFFSLTDPSDNDVASVIVVDDAAWKRVETVTWVQTDTRDPIIEAFEDIASLRVLHASPRDIIRPAVGLDAKRETLGGVKALRFDITPTEEELRHEPPPPEIVQGLLGGGQLVGDDALTMTWWVTPNYQQLLKVRIRARFEPERVGDLFPQDVPEGTIVDYSVTATFTHHDDPSIKIEPPV